MTSKREQKNSMRSSAYRAESRFVSPTTHHLFGSSVDKNPPSEKEREMSIPNAKLIIIHPFFNILIPKYFRWMPCVHQDGQHCHACCGWIDLSPWIYGCWLSSLPRWLIIKFCISLAILQAFSKANHPKPDYVHKDKLKRSYCEIGIIVFRSKQHFHRTPPCGGEAH